MPTTIITEGELELEFDDDWDAVLKWDETPAYLAFSRSRKRLLLIELKDFRRHRIENKKRISKGELFEEVGFKVRDTLAGVRGAARTRADECVAQLAAKIATRVPLTVVLWLKEDRPRNKGRLSEMTQELKKRVRWLTPHAIVRSRSGTELDDHGIVLRTLAAGRLK